MHDERTRCKADEHAYCEIEKDEKWVFIRHASRTSACSQPIMGGYLSEYLYICDDIKAYAHMYQTQAEELLTRDSFIGKAISNTSVPPFNFKR